MKTKLLLFLTLCFSTISISQTTYVPDDNFEQKLIDEGYDTVLDDYVLTANINTVTQLNVIGINITDLTGIEDFAALTNLDCNSNNINTLDVSQNINLIALSCSFNQINGTLDLSQNTALVSVHCRQNAIDQLILPQTTTLTQLWFHDNELTTIDVSQNPNLGYIRGDNNLINGALDLSQNTSLYRIECENNSIDQLILPQTNTLLQLYCRNNQLTALDVDYNASLYRIMCSNNQIVTLNLNLNTALEALYTDSNMITSLDLSSNTALNYLQVAGNDLNYLSIKNGNNSNFISNPVFYVNPSLTCIEVDDADFSANNWTSIDTQHYFSEDCSNLSVDEFNIAAVSLFPNPVLDALFLRFKTVENTTYQLIDLNGQIILKGKLNQQHESINLSNISPGIYFLKLQSANRTAIKKIIKQ